MSLQSLLQHQSGSSRTHSQFEHETRESSLYIDPALYPVPLTSDSFETKSPTEGGAPATPSTPEPPTELAHADVSPPSFHRTVGKAEVAAPAAKDEYDTSPSVSSSYSPNDARTGAFGAGTPMVVHASDISVNSSESIFWGQFFFTIQEHQKKLYPVELG